MSSRGPLIILLLACTSPPLDEVRLAEARFYDADVLADAGVPLVAVEDGEPLTHTVRIVIGPDGVAVDNRAWWLEERAASDPERTALVVRERVMDVERLATSDVMDGPLKAALDEVADTLPEDPIGGPGRRIQIWAHRDATGDQVRAAITTASFAGFDRYQLVARVGRVPRAVLASRPPPFERKPCALHLAHWTGPDRGHWLQTWDRQTLVPADEPVAPDEVVPFVQTIHAACASVWEQAEGELADSPYVPEDPRSWQCVSMGNGLPTGVPVSRVYPVMAAGYAAWPDIVAMGVHAAGNVGRFGDALRPDSLDAAARERLCLGPLALITRPDDRTVLATYGFKRRRRTDAGEIIESYTTPTPMRLHKLLGTRPEASP